MTPTLTPTEIARIREAAESGREMTHRIISGAYVAYAGRDDGRDDLFFSGGPESFAALWRQALEVYGAEARKGK